MQTLNASHMDGAGGASAPSERHRLSRRQCYQPVDPALAKDCRAPIWMTFKQAVDLGGGVRKGEKGSPTIYGKGR
jgi:hypothetical protein